MILKARPRLLEEAAQSLPPVKGELPTTPLRIVEQRQRLLGIPVEELAHYRINPRALDILPTLAVERQNSALRQRVVALAAAQAGQMSWPTLAALIPWIYDSRAFRRAAHGRAVSEPPVSPLPRWLVEHWRLVLGRRTPAARLAAAALEEEPMLARIPALLQLDLSTPLATDTMAAVLAAIDPAALGKQPHTETLRFIESSGVDPTVLAALLRRILARTPVTDPAGLTEPWLEVYALARVRLQGWPDVSPGMWRGLSADALRTARWAQHLLTLQAAFGAEDFRVSAWRQWLEWIVSVEQVRGILAVRIGELVFTEPTGTPTLCRIFAPAVWRGFVERQQASEALLPPPKSLHRLSGTADNRMEIDRFILENSDR